MNTMGRLAAAGVLGMMLAACTESGSITGPEAPRRDDGGFGLGPGGITAPEKPAANGVGLGSGGFVGGGEGGGIGSGNVNGSTSTVETCTLEERGIGLGSGGRTCVTDPTL